MSIRNLRKLRNCMRTKRTFLIKGIVLAQKSFYLLRVVIIRTAKAGNHQILRPCARVGNRERMDMELTALAPRSEITTQVAKEVYAARNMAEQTGA